MQEAVTKLSDTEIRLALEAYPGILAYYIAHTAKGDTYKVNQMVETNFYGSASGFGFRIDIEVPDADADLEASARDRQVSLIASPAGFQTFVRSLGTNPKELLEIVDAACAKAAHSV